jgi:hypothetical protein
MITFNGKQVIVVGIDRYSGGGARIHYVESLGRTEEILIEDLMADTTDELETALSEAPAVEMHFPSAPREAHENI